MTAQRSGLDVTLARSQCAPLWLQGDGLNPPLGDPIREVVQSWQGSLAISSRSTPEHLSGSSGTGPDDRINVARGRLFSPEELLATEHEIVLGFSEIGVGIERVCLRLL